MRKRPDDVPEGRWAIKIWARCEPSRKRMQAWRDAGAVEEDRPRPLYKLVNVFAQDQVDPLPPPAQPASLEPPAVPAIEGESHGQLLEVVGELAGEVGYELIVEDLPAAVDGICHHKPRTISVAERLSANGKLAAGVHELAHALVHVDELAPELSYAEEELVVESTAYLACQTVELATDINSIPYLASWAQDASLEVLERNVGLCDRLARRIENALQATMETSEHEQIGEIS